MNFPDFFVVDPTTSKAFGRIRPEIIGENPENDRGEYCSHVPGISRVSLQDPVTFTHVTCESLRDPVAGTIDLGTVSLKYFNITED